MAIRSQILKCAVIVLLCLVLPSCAGWSQRDKVYMGTYLALSTVDALQTANTDQELNPIFRGPDGGPDMGWVVGGKLVSAGVVLLMANRFPALRARLLTGAIMFQGGAVIYNW